MALTWDRNMIASQGKTVSLSLSPSLLLTPFLSLSPFLPQTHTNIHKRSLRGNPNFRSFFFFCLYSFSPIFSSSTHTQNTQTPHEKESKILFPFFFLVVIILSLFFLLHLSLSLFLSLSF